MKISTVSKSTGSVLVPDQTSSFSPFDHSDTADRADATGNPLIPGYFADPTCIEHEGVSYVFATLDPWGDRTLGCWSSGDFSNWTYHSLDWPTKEACTTAKSHPNMVWAPAVMRAPDGQFYMYVSVGSEIWVGKAPHPLGPWLNPLGDRPLIEADFRPGFHMIDAEAFVDDDGSAYLYWGSGWNWTNGRCWAVRLASDYTSFIGETVDVTPENYFEAPCMVKNEGRYYLMYSQGKTIEDTYRVHYAIGDSPLGPFSEASNSPILTTDFESGIISPGHHTVIKRGLEHYILYHRHSIPMDPVSTRRQLCIDLMNFRPDGLIDRVKASHSGPSWVGSRRAYGRTLAHPCKGVSVDASSEQAAMHVATCAIDGNYATRWLPARDDEAPWIQLDLGRPVMIQRQELRFEYPWRSYFFICECSVDGMVWKLVADHTRHPATGSPVVFETDVQARYFRLRFERTPEVEPSLVEWVVE